MSSLGPKKPNTVGPEYCNKNKEQAKDHKIAAIFPYLKVDDFVCVSVWGWGHTEQ